MSDITGGSGITGGSEGGTDPTQAGERPVELVYAGFWVRLWASLIDSMLLCVIIYPILLSTYGWDYLVSDDIIHGPTDFLLSWVAPAIAVILFWIYKAATPGKMAVSARIVDAATGRPASTGQYIGRYFAYYLSMLPLFLGFLWVAFDSRKQGWHDKLAGTVVIKPAKTGPTPVSFPSGGGS